MSLSSLAQPGNFVQRLSPTRGSASRPRRAKARRGPHSPLAHARPRASRAETPRSVSLIVVGRSGGLLRSVLPLRGGPALASAGIFDRLLDLLQRAVEVLHGGVAVAAVVGAGVPEVILGDLQLLQRGGHLVVARGAGWAGGGDH